jgi:hypothetical protein
LGRFGIGPAETNVTVLLHRMSAKNKDPVYSVQ